MSTHPTSRPKLVANTCNPRLKLVHLPWSLNSGWQGGVKSYSAPPRGVAWEPSFARMRSQAERHPTFQDPLHPRGLGRLRFASTFPSTHFTKNSHDRPREKEWRTLGLRHKPSKIKGNLPLTFNHTNIVCRTGHLLGLILDKHLDRDVTILNFSIHSTDGANKDASSRQRPMYDKSWGTDASVLSSRLDFSASNKRGWCHTLGEESGGKAILSTKENMISRNGV